jgi:hypothetical protein
MDGAALLKECREERYKASGPGGQRRNKVVTAIRLRHQPTGLVVQAEESRFLAENRTQALRRLRERIALDVRAPFDVASPPVVAELEAQKKPRGVLAVSPSNPSYPIIMATALDALQATGSYAKAAHALGITTSQFLRFLRSDAQVLRLLKERQERDDSASR